MSQFMKLPLWMRFEPVLRFDCEGLLELPVPYRSEAFAEDLLDDGIDPVPAVATRCEDQPRRLLEKAPEHVA